MKRLFRSLAVVCLLATSLMAQGNKAYGALTAGVCVTLDLPSDQTGSATIQLTGTFTATVQFEASNDNGTTYVAITGTPLNSTVAVSSATATGTWRFPVSGLTNIRARCSAFTSGPANAVINSGRVSLGVSDGAGFSSGGATADVVPESNGSGGLRDSPIVTDNGVGFRVVEGAAPAGVASSDVFYADSTLHGWKMINNNGSALQVVGVASPTNNILCKFASGNCTNSSVTDDATTVSTALPINSTAGFRVATAAANGAVLVGDGTNFVGKTLQVDKQDPTGSLTGDSSDKTVYTYTMPASTLASGKCLRINFAWQHTTGSASVTYKISFGATAVFNQASSTTGFPGVTSALVCNNASSTTAQWSTFQGTIASSVLSAFATTPAETTTSGTITIKGTFNVAGTDAVTGKGWSVELVP